MTRRRITDTFRGIKQRADKFTMKLGYFQDKY